MSSNPKVELYLEYVHLNPESRRVEYTFTTTQGAHRYSAQISEVSGIRSVVIPKDLEEFLNPFCTIEPSLIKRLVAETWRSATEEQKFAPLRLT